MVLVSRPFIMQYYRKILLLWNCCWIGGCADLNIQDINGYTPLYCAILQENIEFVRLLLDRGANINIQDINDKTPLYYALRNRDIEFIKFLLDNGANIGIDSLQLKQFADY
ncbi:ankyrin repeat domain-containing protein [Spiroplasma endosymbiont of Clivina fossor]|uniref:ankyrin repeat domain-containing protein n=1 Tax=Spiroplasma endosymbiont of Clivina fossor TaxID=3066282 RepID=UPI00313D13C5